MKEAQEYRTDMLCHDSAKAGSSSKSAAKMMDCTEHVDKAEAGYKHLIQLVSVQSRTAHFSGRLQFVC